MPTSKTSLSHCLAYGPFLPDEVTMSSGSYRRLFSVARKELIHILRDPMTLFFTLFLPVLQLFMLGYAIDTNVRHVRTVSLDQAGTRESRALLQTFAHSAH